METQLLEHIVEVAPSWPAEVFIQRHVQALQDEGVAIQVAARQLNLPISSLATVQRQAIAADIARIPAFDKLSIPKKVVAMIHYGLAAGSGKPGLRMRQRALLGFFAELKPKLVHFHNAQLAVGMNWICREMGIPYTVSLRGSDVQVIPLRSGMLYEATRQALSCAAGIHTVCEAFGNSELLEDLQTTTIYTTVPVPDRLRAYQPNDKDGYHLLSVGRLQWRKGYPDLLVALRGLLDTGLNVRLTIAGTGPDEERVQYWIERLNLKDRVHLPGKLNFEQIQELLQSAHAYVQASYVEGLSNSLAEAMAWGCPVFATEVGGTREVIRDGENGFLLEPLAPERWMEQLCLMTDQERMRRVQTAARHDARQHFDAEVHARLFVNFYQKALKRYSISGGMESGAVERETTQNESVVEQHTNGPKMVVRLPWEWQYGTDQVLRALAPMAKAGKLQLYCCGNGSAEDELRYMAYFFGLDQKHIVRIEPESLDALPTRSDEPENPMLVIDCPDQAKPVWKVSDGKRENIAEVGETAKLVRRVGDFLDMNPTRSA